MTKEQYTSIKERIRSDANMVEIAYKKKIVDEYGEQTVIAKVEYVLGDEKVVTEYLYEGDTRNFRCVGTTDTIKQGDEPTIEVTVIIDPKEYDSLEEEIVVIPEVPVEEQPVQVDGIFRGYTAEELLRKFNTVMDKRGE